MKDSQDLDCFAFYKTAEVCIFSCARLEFPTQFRCKGNLWILVLCHLLLYEQPLFLTHLLRIKYSYQSTQLLV